MEVHSLLCEACEYHRIHFYCTKGHDISNFGGMQCRDHNQLSSERIGEPKSYIVKDGIKQMQSV